MKKFLLSFSLIIAFAFYVLLSSNRNSVSQVTTVSITPITDITKQPKPTSLVITTKSTATPQTVAKFKDGTYTGPVTNAYFGNIQVSATINNGRLTDVQFLQYPNDRSTSIKINTKAMPTLKSEAIQSQSAKVDGVSGATQTSQAFSQSLAAALTEAAN